MTNSMALRAHFDGKHIQLDDPFELASNMELLVIVLPERGHDNEHGAWLRLSGTGLARAYGEHDAEYSLDLIKEPNSDYERR